MNRHETHTGHCEQCWDYTWIKMNITNRATCERCHVVEASTHIDINDTAIRTLIDNTTAIKAFMGGYEVPRFTTEQYHDLIAQITDVATDLINDYIEENIDR